MEDSKEKMDKFTTRLEFIWFDGNVGASGIVNQQGPESVTVTCKSGELFPNESGVFSGRIDSMILLDDEVHQYVGEGTVHYQKIVSNKWYIQVYRSSPLRLVKYRISTLKKKWNYAITDWNQ